MLILTRAVGETVRLGPDLKMTVLAGKGNEVRLAFETEAGDVVEVIDGAVTFVGNVADEQTARNVIVVA
ncbi:carbon storage regulator [Marinobacterium sp. BA1]|uniref:carbon storage regulator n=1 Tax=Marinobacterium sp. BA1 TaxID=3138931 RepID=UPI0032E6BDF5